MIHYLSPWLGISIEYVLHVWIALIQIGFNEMLFDDSFVIHTNMQCVFKDYQLINDRIEY